MTNDIGEFAVNPTESKTTGTVGNFSRGSRETPVTSVTPLETDRSEKARCHTSDVYVAGESDRPIVPKKPANNGGPEPPAESVEGRGADQGKHLAIATGPDTEPAHQVARVAGCTGTLERRPSTVSSEVRAVCGKAARTDPCGGWPARAIPTAIASHDGRGRARPCGRPPAQIRT